MSKVTVYTWMKNAKFIEELRRRSDEVYQHSLQTLSAGRTKAVEKLLQLVNSDREDIALGACALAGC